MERTLVATLGGLGVLALGAWLVLPWFLLPPSGGPLRGSPADFGLDFETREVEVGADALVAWWMPADGPPRGCVILLHDGGSNRSFLWTGGLGLARALHERGYAVLAPDLRGHGDSAPLREGVPLGRNLAPDVSHWIDALGDGAAVGVVGFGLGGHTALYAGAADPRIRAVVADSTWADLRSSLRVSLPRVTSLPPALVRSLLWSAEHVHRVDFAQSRAVEVVDVLSGRLLLIANEEDPQVPLRQLRWLAEAAGEAEVWVSSAPPPRHPLYASAGSWGMHTKSFRLYPEEYTERVDRFLSSRLHAQ